ncbi:MAG: type IV pilin protein [Polyangiales bacterium]
MRQPITANPRSLPSRRDRSRHGFSLIELMITVAIIGVLAAIAVPSFQGYLQRSRTTEATTFLADIRQKQETYRAEFGAYCAVDGQAIGTYTPTALPGPGQVQTWPVNDGNWTQLGARPDGTIRFQYATIAGVPGQAPPGTSNLPSTDFWFVAAARGDLDNDGDFLDMETYSGASRVWVSEAKGWE